jgi:xanthine/CO dehydrogenase XdhC/CoxF family maturation factor
MRLSLQRLLPLFERERSLHQPMVLATVVRTDGSTYTKPGAHLLLASDGEYAGLLSGGCFEADLAEHGRAVLATGSAKLVTYDIRGSNDPIFGLGSGCEGAMDILLQRLDAPGDWQPMARLAAAWRAQRAAALLLIVSSTDPAWPPGAAIFGDDGESFGANAAAASRADNDGRGAALTPLRVLAKRLSHERSTQLLPQAVPGIDVLALVQPRPVQILLLGAGPDAQPVAELAAFLGWRVTVVDHRSHYARVERFPDAALVLDGGPPALARLLTTPASRTTAPAGTPAWDAAIIMSHHMTTDFEYLRAIACSDIPYIGLLGPHARSQRLLTDLGADLSRLAARLRAPVGLDLGAVTPEAIALSIIAEIHAAIAGRDAISPMSRKQAS